MSGKYYSKLVLCYYNPNRQVDRNHVGQGPGGLYRGYIEVILGLYELLSILTLLRDPEQWTWEFCLVV